MAEKTKQAEMTFSEFVTDLDHGSVEQQATNELRKLIRAVKSTNRKGKLTVTIDVEPSRERLINVAATVTAKLPVAETNRTPLYADEDGNAKLYDVKQEQLQFVNRTAPARANDGE